jgi:peroxiredoxin
VAISQDSAAPLIHYREKKRIPFHLLADEGSVVIDRYDIRNTWELVHRGAPHPSTYIIDRAGIIRFADVRKNYLWRTKIGTILDELKKLGSVPVTGPPL